MLHKLNDKVFYMYYFGLIKLIEVKETKSTQN